MPIRALVDGRLKFESVLFATDFSPGSYPASLYAHALATHLACPLTVMHASCLTQTRVADWCSNAAHSRS